MDLPINSGPTLSTATTSTAMGLHQGPQRTFKTEPFFPSELYPLVTTRRLLPTPICTAPYPHTPDPPHQQQPPTRPITLSSPTSSRPRPSFLHPHQLPTPTAFS
nr:DM domain-less DMRT1-like protein [Haliotis asinina]